MSFRDKIDKILYINNLGINSVSGLEKYVGASGGAIRKYYEEDKEPGLATIKKIKEKLGIRDAWWDKQDGSPFTDPQKQKDDILDHPLVKSYVSELNTLRKYVAILERENDELRGKK